MRARVIVIIILGLITFGVTPPAWSAGNVGLASCQVDKAKPNAGVLTGTLAVEVENVSVSATGDIDSIMQLQLTGSVGAQVFAVHVPQGSLASNLETVCSIFGANPTNSTGQTIVQAFGFNPNKSIVVTSNSLNGTIEAVIPSTLSLPGGSHHMATTNFTIYIQ